MLRQEVKDLYASYGIDVNKAIRQLANTKISIHCWQLDDVAGFESDASTGQHEYPGTIVLLQGGLSAG